MDALTHAIEAYVSTMATAFTDPLALEAIEMVDENVINSYKGDKNARELMHYAQCMAGMAFSNALLGIVHSMAHKTGAVFHIPHGCANAVYLPYVIDYNKKECADRYVKIAKRLDLIGNSDDELIDALTSKIKELNKAMDIPATLKEYGIDEAEFKEKVEMISERALEDACTGSNPRKIDKETMVKLFNCIYYGEKVDF